MFCGLVEHSVDKAMALFGTKLFRQVDGFINDHLVGNFNAVQQLKSANTQNNVFDDIKLRHRAVKKRLDFLINVGLVLANLSDQGCKQFGVNIAEILFFPKLIEYFTHFLAGQMPLV